MAYGKEAHAADGCVGLPEARRSELGERDRSMTAFYSQTRRDRFSAKLFKALSDRTRQQILHLLEGGSCNVGEIVSNFDLAQPTISRHLSILRNADLVTGERIGAKKVYSLNGEALSDSMLQFFGRFRGCEKVLR